VCPHFELLGQIHGRASQGRNHTDHQSGRDRDEESEKKSSLVDDGTVDTEPPRRKQPQKQVL
jgi:hypothetical protein